MVLYRLEKSTFFKLEPIPNQNFEVPYNNGEIYMTYIMDTKRPNYLVDSDLWYQDPKKMFAFTNKAKINYIEIRKTSTPQVCLHKL